MSSTSPTNSSNISPTNIDVGTSNSKRSKHPRNPLLIFEDFLTLEPELKKQKACCDTFESPLSNKSLRQRAQHRMERNEKTAKEVQASRQAFIVERRKNPNAEPQHRSHTAPKKLFADVPKESVEESATDFTYYDFDFETPDPSVPLKEWQHLKKQVELLDKIIDKTASFKDSHKTNKEKIKTILKSAASFNEKMAELGLMYFYFDREGHLVNPKKVQSSEKESHYFLDRERIAKSEETSINSSLEISFQEYRIYELKSEFTHITQTTNTALPKNVRRGIPQGKSYYLLRAFAHMLFSQGGEFNPGAAYAITKIVTQQSIIRFKGGHDRQIKKVLEHLLSNQSLIDLLNTPVSLHEDGEKIIRMDLKLSEDTLVLPFHTKVACVFALLFARRQHFDEGDCFAIAPITEKIINHPELLVKYWQNILSTAHFEINETNPLPCFPLLTERMLPHHHLNVSIPEPTQLKNLPTLQTISRCLDLDLINTMSKENECFEDNIGNILTANNQQANLPITMALINSFYFNMLHEILIAHFTLTNANGSPSSKKISEIRNVSKKTTRATSTKNLPPVKDTIMNWLSTHLQEALRAQNSMIFDKPSTNDFFSILEGNLRSCFFLEDVLKTRLFEKDGSICVRNDAAEIELVGPAIGNSEALTTLLTEARRFVFKEGDKFTKIYHFNAFIETIDQVLDKSLNDYNPSDPVSNKIVAALKKHLKDPAFVKGLAKTVRLANPAIKFSDEDYAKSGLFLLHQHGGSPQACISHIFKEPVERITFVSKNELEFIINLIKHVSTDFAEQNGCILASSKNHAFTITPYQFETLLKEDSKTLRSTIEERYIAPVKQLEINKDKATTILENIHFNKRVAVLNSLTFPLKVRTFIDVVSKHLLNPEQKHNFFKELDNQIFKITLTEEKFATICKELGVHESKAVNKLYLKFTKRLATKNYHATPLITANILNRLLARININIPLYTIESVVCRLENLPESLIIGDTNYIKEEENQGRNTKENPVHVVLALSYSFEKDALRFYQKDDINDLRTEHNFFESMSTMHLLKTNVSAA